MKPGTINYEFVKTGSSLSDEVNQIIDDHKQIKFKLKKEEDIWRSMEYGGKEKQKGKGKKVFREGKYLVS